ncbi:hypothetical protein [Streptomyces sp. NBC_01013]|uniref:hypothetical protein n=1 Tax=Streptomyces sp. NBC_01013 TaxID=2903718 RepID=UPI00386C2B64|nr:hypothetical protein OG538_34220 [Streptomyces sp. NBC_01013]
MTGTSHRAADAVRRLGLRVVLLAFWGTSAALSRRCAGPRIPGGESVRRKA